ncbi:MAG: diguanylate cyclase, partial [Selenomonas sp.]|nr:diguanylate cyclase [Selenomonas sp.]
MFRCHLLIVMAGTPEVAVKAMKGASLPTDCQMQLEVVDSLADLPMMAERKCAAVIMNTMDDWTPERINAQFGPDTCLVLCTDRMEDLSAEQLNRACRVWPLSKLENYWSFFCQHLLEDLYKQKELWHTRNCLQTVVDTMPGFVWFKDMEGHHLKVNQAFCEMVGKSMQEVEGKEHYEIWGVSPEQYAEGEYVCLETDKAIAANPKPTLFQEQVLHSKLGLRQLETYKAPIFDEDGKMIGNIGVAKDVTEEYAYKERILLLSRTDELTRLANRRYFYQFVDSHRREGAGALTLCYIDLDYFKQLNDTFGHQYGDAALMAMG